MGNLSIDLRVLVDQDLIAGTAQGRLTNAEISASGGVRDGGGKQGLQFVTTASLVYDEAKRFSEALTMAYHRYHAVDTRLVRIFNTYGPRMQLNDGRVIPNFMKQALRGEDLTVYGDGKQTRSFCYVTDEIDGFLRLSKTDEHFPVNIGNPNEFTVLECAKRVIAVTESKSKIRFEKLPQDDPKQRRPDISKARKLLGWEPKVGLDDGLQMSLEYFRVAVAAEVPVRSSMTLTR